MFRGYSTAEGFCASSTLDWLTCLAVLTNIDEVCQMSAQHLMACFDRL